MWAFLPGTTDWFVPGNDNTAQKYGSAAWVMLNDAGANNGPTPVGRTEHCAGNLGDQLYIYGGQTAMGPVSPADALWTYNLASQTWVNIPNANPSPQIGFPGSFVTGTFIGHHFYVYVENYDNKNMWVSGQLWRWGPNNAALPPGVAYPTPYNPSGHTAGIVIGILLGIANCYFLWLLLGNAGVSMVPAWVESIPYVGQYLGGGGAKKPPTGFYTSSASTLNSGGGGAGYAAPPEL